MKKEEIFEAALIADSLALAPHWNYDPADIKKTFGTVDQLLKPPAGSYHDGEPAGGQTHYGHQTSLLANCLRQGWDIERFRNDLKTFWENSNAYKDHATKAFLAGEAPASTELAGASRCAAVIALVEEEEEAVKIARDQAGVTHGPSVAQAAEDLVRLAFLLRSGQRMVEAVEKVYGDMSELRRAQEVGALAPNEALGELGRDCSLKSALPSLLYLLLREEPYRETLIANVMAGGDSAARGLPLGALLALSQGDGAVPAAWKAQHPKR